MPKKQKKNPPSEFPIRIYSELTDIAFPSDQALINPSLRGKERVKQSRENEENG